MCVRVFAVLPAVKVDDGDSKSSFFLLFFLQGYIQRMSLNLLTLCVLSLLCGVYGEY